MGSVGSAKPGVNKPLLAQTPSTKRISIQQTRKPSSGRRTWQIATGQAVGSTFTAVRGDGGRFERLDQGDAQSDPRFTSWLEMQEAAVELEFIMSDVPELKPHLYTREGIVIVESAALERFSGWREAFTGDNLTLAMRFVYVIGETFRRHTAGRWVAVPQAPPKSGAIQAIDSSFRSGFYVPTELLQVALAQRTGDKIVRVFDHALRAEQKWVDAGRPQR